MAYRRGTIVRHIIPEFSFAEREVLICLVPCVPKFCLPIPCTPNATVAAPTDDKEGRTGKWRKSRALALLPSESWLHSSKHLS